MSDLFSPLALGEHRLDHRVVMAPLTRMRAEQPGNVPGALAAEYYGQRATPGGLIVTEASQVMPTGQGYPATPGIHSARQVAGWRGVVEAVHARGGKIFLQLWHVGRVSHSSHQPGGVLPVAPSAVRPAGTTLTADWQSVPFETPRALGLDEISGIVEAFRWAALNAREAGFDGVEIHGANGYLLEQFLQSRTNLRTDGYGGSIENRARLLFEVTEAVVQVWRAGRVGIRLSPFGTASDSGEAEPMPLYSHVVRRLAPLGLAYLHLVEPAGNADGTPAAGPTAAARFRPLWPGALITAGGFDRARALEIVGSGDADAVAFGRWFIANPDLPQRLKSGAALNAYDRATFYGGGAAGYTDYPTLQQKVAA